MFTNPDSDYLPGKANHLRISHELGEWTLDAVDEAFNYSDQCATFGSFHEAVAFIPTFLADCETDGLVIDWRCAKPTPHALYYVSQDVLTVPGAGTVVLPTWSVYVEGYAAIDDDEPATDGQWVARHENEAEAHNVAERLQRAYTKTTLQ